MSNRAHDHNERGDVEVVAGIGGIALVILLIAAWIITTAIWVNTPGEATCTIQGKESVAKGESGHEYRVYTDKCGTFAVHDELWLGRFNAADTYGSIKEGKTYSLETVGWRNGFFSTFPNIINAQESK
ncbi:hypothetical protein ACIPY0_20400 [Paenarthrobacter nicotinovorans]|uniref:hypothetical protein n=1 Tax=Paenarthrobacter nicotinovorans TaxID=29320 RepID=UPI0037F5D7BF